MKKRILKALILLLCLAGFVLYGYYAEKKETEKIRGVISNKRAGIQMDLQESREKEGRECVLRVALTFDDGPHPYYTEQILDGLKLRGVKATFFVTGEHADLHPDIVKRMQDEGHLIGNHTFRHIMLRKDNRAEFKKELQETNEVIHEITGENPSYVRPPYGAWDKKLEKELDMFPVGWTIDPLDWCSKNADCIEKRVMDAIKGDDIILFHDYYETSVTAALNVVDELLKKGYEFVTVDQLLFD